MSLGSPIPWLWRGWGDYFSILSFPAACDSINNLLPLQPQAMLSCFSSVRSNPFFSLSGYERAP